MLVDIDKIKVTDRIRKEFGNIEELAADIKQNSLLNPITVVPTNDGTYQLIAGERRLRACKHLGMTSIVINAIAVRDAEQALRIEIAENENRKEFSFSERMEWARRLEDVEKLKAEERKRSSQFGSTDTQNFAEPEKGETADIVANKSGFGNKETYRQAKFIAEHAGDEIIRQLDEKQLSVHAAYQKLKREAEEAKRRAEELEFEAEQNEKKFRDVIPKDLIPEIEGAAVERHQEETALYIREKEKEAEAKLKQQEKQWKEKLAETLEQERIKVEQLKTGYQSVKEELEAIKLRQTDDFDEQMAAAQMKKLRFEADNNTIQVSIHIKQFLQKVGITSFMLGAVAEASGSEKKRLTESLDMLQSFIDQLKPALNGRKVVGK